MGSLDIVISNCTRTELVVQEGFWEVLTGDGQGLRRSCGVGLASLGDGGSLRAEGGQGLVSESSPDGTVQVLSLNSGDKAHGGDEGGE